MKYELSMKTIESGLAGENPKQGLKSKGVLTQTCLEKEALKKTESKQVRPEVIPLSQEEVESGGGKKRKYFMSVLAVILSIALIFIILNAAGITVSDKQNTQQKKSDLDDIAVSGETAGISWKVPEKIGNSFRDITSTQMKSEPVEIADTPRLSVTGIVIYNNKNKSAIINDVVVREGDTIRGVKISNINSDSVIFEKDGVKWTIKVN